MDYEFTGLSQNLGGFIQREKVTPIHQKAIPTLNPAIPETLAKSYTKTD